MLCHILCHSLHLRYLLFSLSLSLCLSLSLTATLTHSEQTHTPHHFLHQPLDMNINMEKKADVKAMLVRFQSGGVSVDETCSPPVGQIKQPLKPTFSSGLTPLTKKPVLESNLGGAMNTPPKPSFLKPINDVESHEPSKAKVLASRFGNVQDDSNAKPTFGNKPLKSPLSQAHEAKSPAWKPPTAADSKPAFLKPSASAFNSKPSWVKEDSGGGFPKAPSSSIVKMRLQSEETAEGGTNTAAKPSPPPSFALKPTSNFKASQGNFNKEPHRDAKADAANKPTLSLANSAPPPKPPPSKKPSVKKPRNLSPHNSSNVSDDPSGPKRNPLPNSLALGPAPAKPNRPLRVNLESFKPGPDQGPGTVRKSTISTPAPPTQSPQAPIPSLPPRPLGAMSQQEECYDDIDHLEINSAPPPLPPSTGHPSHRAKAQEEDDNSEDGDMYEALDERWDVVEQQQEKKKEKEDKEEKKRLEAEKKEQKEREKREQDARKKFKLVGPIEVVHQGKALVDCRSNKTDLALKQGDSVDIIRVQGNPEGKWLARLQDGSIGYVKTTSVEIDFNMLKKHSTQLASDPEIYDDIDVAVPEKSGIKGPGVAVPQPPEDDGEIYDDILESNVEASTPESKSSPMKPHSFLRRFERSRRPFSTKVMPPPSLPQAAEGNSDHVNGAIDEEIYDDVDSPPPPISSPPQRGKSKTEEFDPKKQKKFEKEEKDFRKKFKYEGQIQVLSQVTISQTLTNKKWGAKELSVKAGEKLDVIVKAVDDKLICRNDDGKFGYVSTSHIDLNDGDIYDDIGEDCIYDND